MNIAARYARGLFALDGDAAARQQKLDALCASCATPQVLDFWQHPGVALQARQELAIAIAESIDRQDQQLRNFLLLLVEQRRMPLLPAITTQHEQLVKKQAGIVDVVVTSSHTLQAEQQQEIATTVAAYLQKKINLSFIVDAKILGGLLIAWEHKVWDFSLHTKLQAVVKHAVG